MKQQFLFCLLTALLLVPHLSASNLPWAVTATAFKLVDGMDVNNVKLNWAAREDADTYRVYRNGELLKEVRTVTLDDYDLPVGESFTYYVEAVKGGMVVVTSEAQQAETFTPTGSTRVYDNLNGKYLTSASTEEPQGMKIDDVYYIYRMECVMRPKNGRNVRHWTMTESFSSTGLKGSWSQPRVLATYSDVNFEGNGFRYNPNTGKVVFSSHYEDSVGYTAAKIFLAQITPKGGVEVGTQERPLGYDSRDQSLFIDEDNTAYLLSATRMNNDINIYRLDETWTKPVELVNTIYKGLHRETPAILKRDGEYYCFSSKASGWYPSQTVCISASSLDGEWSPVQEVGNNSTFDAQFNGIDPKGDICTVRSYHWGAQRKHKTQAGNFPRISIATFNKGYVSMDYYRYIEFDEAGRAIPVQNGKNLSLGKPVSSAVNGGEGISPDCLTDGAAMTSSPYFIYGSSTPAGTPYTLTVDLQEALPLREINLATRLVNGSETAYKFTIEGSVDGKQYTMLFDGKDNWTVGFQIVDVTDSSPYRYLRLHVHDLINVHNNNSARWANGIYEFTVFGGK